MQAVIGVHQERFFYYCFFKLATLFIFIRELGGNGLCGELKDRIGELIDVEHGEMC